MPSKTNQPASNDFSTYGQYNGDPNPEQLSDYFTLQKADLEIIQTCRYEHTKLGMAVQLCTLRFLGTFLSNPINVPVIVVQTLETQLGLHHVRLERYLENKDTRFDHARIIREHLGYKEFDRLETLHVLRLVYARFLINVESIQASFDVITQELEQRKIVLPGQSTISRLIARVRERTNGLLYRQLAVLLNRKQTQTLEDLLIVPEGLFRSPLERLRLEPTRISVPSLLRSLERIKEIRAVGVGNIDLRAFPVSRLQAICRHAAGAWAATISKYNPSRRRATLLAFIQDLERSATDDALTVFEGVMHDIGFRAEQNRKQKRWRTLNTLDASALKLAQGITPVFDENITGEALRAAIFTLVNREALLEAQAQVVNLAERPAEIEPELWAAAISRITAFIMPLLSTIHFECAPSGKAILEAITYLKRTTGTAASTWGEAPTSVVPKRWKPRVFPNGIFDRQAYVVCVAHQLHRGLRKRDVFVVRSNSFADPRAQLLQGKIWEEVKADVIRSLQLPAKPEAMIERLSRGLQVTYSSVSNNLDKNPFVTVKEENGVMTLMLTPLEALPESASYKDLKTEIELRTPTINLPELILEMNARTGLVSEIIKASGVVSKSADLEKSVVAVLMAEACNIGLKVVSREDVPALTLSRLAFVKQNYVRAETINQANIKLVEYHSRLPIVQKWGGGEVASADGLRFVVPVRSVHAGFNRKYFGSKRGITYYTLTSDQYTMLHGVVVPGTLRDSLFLLGTVLEQKTNLNPSEIMTDSAGYSDIVFGLFHLLGYQFSPRIKELVDIRYWRIGKGEGYGRLKGLAKPHKINLERIAQHWEDVLRLTGSLKLGAVRAPDVLRVLVKDGDLSGLGKAVREVGRVAKTMFLLNYANDEAYRRRIHTQLNRGELRGKVARWVLHGHRGQIRRQYQTGMELQLGSLGLVVNVVVLWNTLYTAEILSLLEAMGEDVLEEDVARLSPLRWRHVNVLGRYEFELLPGVEAGDLRPLRDPNSVSELELALLREEEE
jgi:TnpA family transposase